MGEANRMRRCCREVCRSGFGADLETRVRVIAAADQRHAEAAVLARVPQSLSFMNPGIIGTPEKNREQSGRNSTDGWEGITVESMMSTLAAVVSTWVVYLVTGRQACTCGSQSDRHGYVVKCDGQERAPAPRLFAFSSGRDGGIQGTCLVGKSGYAAGRHKPWKAGETNA